MLPNLTPGQVSLNLYNSMTANGIFQPDWMNTAYGLDGGYDAFSYMVDNNAPPRKVEGNNGQFVRYILGYSAPAQAVLATSAQAGVNVIVTYTQNGYDLFRNTDNVQNNVTTNVRAGVTNAHPGGCTLVPLDDNTPLNVADWIVGNTMVSQWNTQDASSGGLPPIYEVPYGTTNSTEITRDTCRILAGDISKSYAISVSGKYWYFAQEGRMLMNFRKKRERKGIWGKYGFVQNGRRKSGNGLYYAIQDPYRGGVDNPFTSVPSVSQFEDFANAVATTYNEENVVIHCKCGRGFLGLIQSFTTPFIQASGINNTFDVSKGEGIDSRMWAAAGVTIVFSMLPILNLPAESPNPTSIFPGQAASSYYCFAIDMGTFDDGEHSGAQLPAMERIYYGTSKSMLYKVMPGVIDHGSIVYNDTIGMSNIAVSDVDAVAIQIYEDSQIDIMAQHCGMMRPQF